MKKIVISTLSTLFILGLGTAVYAAGNNSEADKETMNFEKMKPMMEEMHPDFSNEELKEMFDTCHGKNGMMQDQNMKHMKNMNPENMMNQF